MNLAQRQNVLNTVNAIQSFDFDEYYVANTPEGTSIDSLVFGEWSITRFKELLNKAIQQLKNEIEEGAAWEFLPSFENFQNEFGAFNVEGDLQSLNNNIRNYTIRPQSAEVLRRLIYYEVRQGFWDKSAVRKHDVNEEQLIALQGRLDITQKNLDRNIDSFQQLNKQYKDKLEEFATQIATSNDQLSSINDRLTTATSSNNTITELLASAKNKDTEISGLRDNINDKIKTVTENTTTYQTAFEAFQKSSAELSKQLITAIDEATTNFTVSKASIEFIESKREEIMRLTGMAADGSLGSKFDQRQIALDKRVNIWMAAVGVISLVAIAWTVIVFVCLSAKTDNPYINILVNLIKTSPGFFLMGFVIKQYSKERNLQEEYAFKSAVAMTLTAYSAMLEKSDEDNNKSRQQMLMKSIEQVYNQPKIYNEKNDTMFSFKTRDLKDAVKDLTGVVKDVTKTGK